jgi:TonB family protein
MLGQLVESSPRRVRRRFSTLVSIVAHALMLSAAIAAARPVPKEPTIDRVIPWYPAPPPPPPCVTCASPSAPGSPGPTTRTESALPGRITSEFTIDVPETVGPAVDGPPISNDEWRGMRTGHSGDTASVLGGDVVDREVVPWPTNPVPRYPATLRAARIEGSVQARFVVDTTGRVVMTSVIVDGADHPLFAEAVLEVLRRARFTPAELRGRKVQQLVVQPFVFVIRE